MKRASRTIAGLLVAGLTVSGCATMSGGDWVTLFDGKDLNQWYLIGDADWKLEDGMVMAERKIGKANGFVHIWGYQSMDQRMQIRDEARKKGVWPPGGGGDRLISQQNKIVMPSAFSPLQ